MPRGDAQSRDDALPKVLPVRRATCSTARNMQHMQHAAHVTCSTCNMQHSMQQILQQIHRAQTEGHRRQRTLTRRRSSVDEAPSFFAFTSASSAISPAVPALSIFASFTPAVQQWIGAQPRCTCARVCVRACVCACVRARACVRACVHACVCGRGRRVHGSCGHMCGRHRSEQNKTQAWVRPAPAQWQAE